MSFDADITNFSVNARAKLRSIVKKTGFEMQDRIVERTPFDTGRAKSSWNIVEGEDANLDTTPDLRGSQKSPGAGLLTEEQAAQVATNQQNGIDILKEPIITVSNNLPYIEPLENGHSKQAPNGMFAITVAEFELIVKGVSP
jgi:hypothetical protein